MKAIVADALGQEGYQLKQFTRTRDKLIAVCPLGHTFEIFWWYWKKGSRCTKCAPMRAMDAYLRLAKENGIKFDPEELESDDSLVTFTCVSYGHSRKVKASTFRMKPYCHACTLTVKAPIEDFAKSIGSKILESHWEEKKKDQSPELYHKLHIQCERGHRYWTSAHKLRKNPKCNGCQSQDRGAALKNDAHRIISGITAEGHKPQDLDKYVISNPRRFYVKYQARSTNVSRNVIWDCGSAIIKQKHEDLGFIIQDLFDQDFQPNAESITFRENELRDKMDIVQSILNSRAGKCQIIYARNCTLSTEIARANVDQFMIENHLMGVGASARPIGAYRQQELLALLTYQVSEYSAEIVRLATKKGFTIVGILSRFLARIRDENPGLKEITSFVDLRYMDGHSLTKLGFKLDSISKGWSWTDGQNVFNRLKCRANMDERKLTQSEQAEEFGWWRIKDAGQAKFVLRLNRK